MCGQILIKFALSTLLRFWAAVLPLILVFIKGCTVQRPLYCIELNGLSWRLGLFWFDVDGCEGRQSSIFKRVCSKSRLDVKFKNYIKTKSFNLHRISAQKTKPSASIFVLFNFFSNGWCYSHIFMCKQDVHLCIAPMHLKFVQFCCWSHAFKDKVKALLAVTELGVWNLFSAVGPSPKGAVTYTCNPNLNPNLNPSGFTRPRRKFSTGRTYLEDYVQKVIFFPFFTIVSLNWEPILMAQWWQWISLTLIV